ncbi:MAG: ribokinase [Caulobacteraceae bacterium]
MSVCVLGSINLDIVCQVAELPAAGETIAALGLERYPGGKGANQAAASARWGATTTLIGAVGLDEAGEGLLTGLREAGVDTSRIARITGQPTGQAHICVSAAGENMIIVVGGANRALGAAHIAALDLTGFAVFLAQLETPIPAIEALFVGAAAHAGVTILNAAPALAEGSAIFPLADILVVNQTELVRYAGAGDIAEAARRLISRPGQSVVVTLGPAGAAAVDAEEVLLVAGRAAKVVDTTGAGDCFCGVLAACLDEGADLPIALARANAAAALSTQFAGAAGPSTLRAQVDALG